MMTEKPRQRIFGSSDESEWWIHDVRDVETVSLISF